ncbi:MAG TPA: CinA family nicotinamide mononucleotide deamidase-related protein [Patescibacteria group bacterium]|nr:CinA family nicotinamide mononucleotide deamidase-related protein [Patescibacteria group bacterium]
MERVEIIAVGDEILRGEVREFNSSFLSRELARIGLAPVRVMVLPDDVAVLEEAVREGVCRSTLVVVTGGLGPTVDDVTVEAVIRALGGKSEVRDDIVHQVEARFRELGRPMPPAYRNQARVPCGAVVLPNTVGAAVGLRLGGADCDLFLLPGVPGEMREMFNRSVLPAVSGRGTNPMRRLATIGLTETELEERLEQVLRSGEPHRLSIISGASGVDLYIPLDSVEDGVFEDIRLVLGSYCYTTGEESFEKVVVTLCAERRKCLTTAESVTGGLLASTVVSVPGASDVLIEGFVTYSDASKIERLGVDAALVRRYGAVSEEVCVAMARGARERSGADFALSTTGIAGPGGGTAEKPVGLCYAGLAVPGAAFCRRFRLAGTREMVRQRTAYRALDLLRLHLIGAHDRLPPRRAEER